jgi:hypothetical protein
MGPVGKEKKMNLQLQRDDFLVFIIFIVAILVSGLVLR